MEPSALADTQQRGAHDRLVDAHKHLIAAHEALLLIATPSSAAAALRELTATATNALAQARSLIDGERLVNARSEPDELRHPRKTGGARVAPTPEVWSASPTDCDEAEAARPVEARLAVEESSEAPMRRPSVLQLSSQVAGGGAVSRRPSAFSSDARERHFDGAYEKLQPVIDQTFNLSFALRVDAITAWERQPTGDEALDLGNGGRSFIAVLIPILRKQQQFIKFMEAVSIIQETLTILIDQLMDFLVVIILWDDREQRGDAIIMLCMLFVAHVSMGTISLVTGQGPTMTLLSLLGFKPIVEGARQLNGTKARPGQTMSNDIMFAFTRIADAAFETIPQSFYQSMVFFSSNERQIGQWISLAFGLMNISISVAGANQFLDTLEYYRKREPLYFGYFPGDAFAAFQLHIAEMGFVYFYAASKLVAVGILGAASKLAVVAWLAAECILLLLVRNCVCGSWRFYQNNDLTHGVGVSLCAHVCIYACMLASPFSILRLPNLLSPAIYSGVLAYSLCVANPAMIALGFFIGDDHAAFGLTVPYALHAVGIPTLLCLGCAALVWHSMVPAFRKSFTSHVPCSKHLEWWWYEAESYGFNGAICRVEDGDRDALRWDVMRTFAPEFWTRLPVKDFLAESWARWETETPVFFIAESIAKIPDAYLPPAALEARRSARLSGVSSFLSSFSSSSFSSTVAP